MFSGIVEWLIASGYICDEDREIVLYGLEQGVHSVLGILVTLMMGYTLNILIQSIMFLVAFIPLRMYIGGYHASTRTRCAIISAILMIAALVWIRWCNLSTWQMLVWGLIECIILFFIIPVDGTIKLEEVERKIYRKRGCTILLIEMLIFIVTGNMINAISKSLMAVFTISLFLTILGLIRNRMQNVMNGWISEKMAR